ncbi:MAG: hypothetical protein WCO02_09235 [Bacteroidota bacterium]
MKATNNITRNITKSLIVLTSIFFFQINTISAEGFNTNPPVNFTVNNLVSILAPTAPSISDFNDAELNLSDITNLAPVTPAEADFNDSFETTYNINTLAPVTPAEADFSDAEIETINMTTLAPTTPSEASFND